MKKRFTRLFTPLMCAFGLGAVLQAQAAPVPVALTGFTADVVADGTGTALSRISADFDAAGYALMATGYTNPAGATATSGLPTSGLISSAATAGLTFQLAAYTANNSLRLLTGTGVLTLATPRTAGDVYVLASSGSDASTVGMTVTFSDGTTQVFPAVTVPDWYGGTPFAITGLGRVNVTDNTIQNVTTDPRLYQYRLAISAANIGKLVQSVSFNKTSTTGVLNVMAISVNPVCTGAPTAGTATATATNTCAAAGIVVSLTGASTDGGLAYQWQASTNGGTAYTDIAGATSATYTVSGQTTTTLYRARLTCSGTGQSSTSSAVTIASTAPTYATLPVIESFESTWLDVCNTRDVPTASWRNTPGSGNNSWRREDDGAAAAWVSPNSWSYTPSASQGTHSARFHSGEGSNGSMGTFDLYVNLSAAGAKRLSFAFINTSGNDSLVVQLSTNGGTTFTALAGYKLSSTFTTQVLPISATSATSVIRFRGRADFGTTDIGLDNVILESATGCLTPASLTATTTTTTASLSWLTGGAGTYTVVYGPTGFNPALPASTTNAYTTVAGVVAPPYAVTGLLPGTAYQFYVTQNCSATTASGTAGPATFTTQIVNDEPCGAVVLAVNNTCTPLSGTTIGATNTAGIAAGTCPSFPTTLPLDVWYQFTTAATGPTSTQVRISVTGTGANTLRAYSATACTGPFTFLSCSSSTGTTIAAPNLDLTSLLPSTTYYVRVSGYSTAVTSLGNFTICASPVPNCPVPSGLTATALTNTTATLNWVGTAGSTYTVYYGPTGFTPPAGTALTGLSTTSTAITGLTPSTAYQFYVQQVCGGFNGSSTLAGPISFTTPLTAPANDEPCGATALGTAPITATNSGATTSIQNGINTPTCAGGSLPKDVWFAFTSSATSTTLTLTGNPAGAVRVFTAPNCSTGPFVQVFCQGSAAANTAIGTVSITGLTAGTRYYLAVSGFGSSDTSGSFAVSGNNLLASKVQAETNALLVYPNPSNTGQLALRLSGFSGTGQATLLNALGQVVLAKTLTNTATEQTLTTRSLAAGLYTLRVAIGDQILTRKVVLE